MPPIAKPTQDAIESIMRVLRANRNPDNSFFISKATGGLVGHAYVDRDSYLPSIPKGSYEVDLCRGDSESYEILAREINSYWERANSEEQMKSGAHTTTIEVYRGDVERLRKFGYPAKKALASVLDIAEGANL